MLREEPRAASVKAKGVLKTNSVDRDSFKRLLGPLEDMLKRSTVKYEKYMQNNKK